MNNKERQQRNANRPIHEQDGGPVPHRLPPAHKGPLMGGLPVKKVKAGCWPVLALILLSLVLLGCGLAEGVRKFAEPIDKTGCFYDCEREGLEFSSYDYYSLKCLCLDSDGNEIELYGLDLEEAGR